MQNYYTFIIKNLYCLGISSNSELLDFLSRVSDDKMLMEARELKRLNKFNWLKVSIYSELKNHGLTLKIILSSFIHPVEVFQSLDGTEIDIAV